MADPRRSGTAEGRGLVIILLGGVAVLLLARIAFAVMLGTAVRIVEVLQRLVLFVARWIG